MTTPNEEGNAQTASEGVTLEALSDVDKFWNGLGQEKQKMFVDNVRYLVQNKLMERGKVWNVHLDQLPQYESQAKSNRIKSFLRELFKEAIPQPDEEELEKFGYMLQAASNAMQPVITKHQYYTNFHNYEYLCIALVLIAVVALAAPHCSLALFMVSLGVNAAHLLSAVGAAPIAIKAAVLAIDHKTPENIARGMLDETVNAGKASGEYKEAAAKLIDTLTSTSLQNAKQRTWTEWINEVNPFSSHGAGRSKSD